MQTCIKILASRTIYQRQVSAPELYIVDVCLFQVVITHCCGKLTHVEICQCRGDFNT